MPIEFVCNACGRKMRAPDGTGGRMAKCPGCGGMLRIPYVGSDAPSAAPRPAPAGQPQQAPQRGSQAPAVPPPAGTLVGQCFAAITYGFSNLGAFVKLVVYAIGLVMIVDLIVSFFRSFLFFTAVGQMLLVLVVLWGELVISGYWLRFFLDGTISSLEGSDQAPDVPDFDLKELFRTGLKGMGMALVYVMPIVTIPLLPLGLLALADSDDSRAFDLVWAVREAGRRPGPLLRVWPAMLLWGGLMVVVDVLLTIATFTLAGLSVTNGWGILGSFVLIAVGGAIIAAVTAMFMTVVFRCVGMLGRFHPEYLDALPEAPGAGRVAGSFAFAVACVLALFLVVIPRVLPPMAPVAD